MLLGSAYLTVGMVSMRARSDGPYWILSFGTDPLNSTADLRFPLLGYSERSIMSFVFQRSTYAQHPFTYLPYFRGSSTHVCWFSD